jgi:hypothetical protein
MKKSNTVWIITAVCLIISGAIISLLSLEKLNFDFNKLNTHKFISNENIITEDFSNIKIGIDTSDIAIVRSKDNICKVVTVNTENIKHIVTVENNVLLISAEDNRKWYDYVGIFSEEPSLTIHLPKDSYDFLKIECDTSDITVQKGFTFGEVEIETDTGDIGFSADSQDIINISTDTGDVVFGNIKASDITLESDTGYITFNSVDCKNIKVETETGDVTFNSSVTSEGILVTSGTGDVTFNNSDAAEISITTDTGDVKGRLLSPKVFVCSSDTGDIDVPVSITGGKCEIKTNTGDIEMYANK